MVWGVVAASWALLLGGAGAAQAAGVRTVVRATWQSTPLLLEASEFLAGVSPDLFWAYVDGVGVTPGFADDKEEYDFVQRIAEPLLPTSQTGLFRLALGLREFSPAVQMFAQLAESETEPPSADCANGAFVHVGTHTVCDVAELERLLTEGAELGAGGNSGVELHTFDHVRGYPADGEVTAVLYGQLGTQGFSDLNNVLASRVADRMPLRYAVRHRVTGDRGHVRVGGYGVELAIKSMEYKAMDDRSSHADDGDRDAAAGVDLWSDIDPSDPFSIEGLNVTSVEIGTVPEKKIRDLGLLATQTIMNAEGEGALVRLQQISQNLPLVAQALAEKRVRKSVRAEVQYNTDVVRDRLGLAPGQAVVRLNGIELDPMRLDVFGLSAHVRQDTSLVQYLYDFDVPAEHIHKIMKVGDPHYVSQEGFAQRQINIDLRSPSVLYANDIESDAAYAAWPTNVQEYLVRSFGFKRVRHNSITVVFLADVLSPEARTVALQVKRFLEFQVPIRFGFLFYTDRLDDPGSQEAADDDMSVAVLRAFAYVREKHDQATAFDWLMALYEVYEGRDGPTMDDVARTLENVVGESGDVRAVVGNGAYDSVRLAAERFIRDKGLDRLVDPAMFVNGKMLPLHAEMLEMELSQLLQQYQFEITRAVWTGQIHDGTDVYAWYLDKPGVLPTYSPRLMDSTLFLGPVLPVGALAKSDEGGMRALTSRVYSELEFFVAPNTDEPGLYDVTTLLVADLSTVRGVQLALLALSRLEDSRGVRTGFVHMGNGKCGAAEEVCAVGVLKAAARAFEADQARHLALFVLRALEDAYSKGDTHPDLRAIVAVAAGDGAARVWEHYDKALRERLDRERIFGSAVLNATGPYVITGGRLHGPLSPDESWRESDFAAAEQRARDWASAIRTALGDDRGALDSDTLLRVMALMGSMPVTRTPWSNVLLKEHTFVEIAPQVESSLPSHDLLLVVDPLSKAAQRLAQLIMAIHESANVRIRLHLLPTMDLPEVPLKRFYRTALHAKPTFSSDGRLLGPSARFGSLPQTALLTLGVDAPAAWDVMAVKCVQDLDNLHLSSVHGDKVHAEFELTDILVEGHMFDEDGQPPRGLQLDLGTTKAPHMHDTLVMANLGYYQLKSNPGLWRLRIREGRSAQLYMFSDGTGSRDVVVNSFTGTTLYTRVKKRPGMEHEKLLDSEVLSKGDDDDDTINVFSIASGHLYERFMSLMMLSVRKHTDKKVKFWLFEPPMSPNFKQFLPHLAAEYGFEYEFVTYKWPKWLREQTEKQRIIWGYKILFLDVLFPLDVKRIIFVDADQIVRADLHELVTMDLKGAPYGYTPFCNDRPEMEQFRFWSGGYWKDHLRGRPYHISALYVVDLVRFRQLAAGDQLRQQYHGLSADPNSLANLDQDLPNNMIHELPIFSLPQQWLWCETWCSDASKPAAKTIDLCNNPLTKEPKLTAAKRIVPEWVALDAEVQALRDRLAPHEPPAEPAAKDSGRDEL